MEAGFEVEGRVVAEADAAAFRGFAQQQGRPRAAGPEHLRVLSLVLRDLADFTGQLLGPALDRGGAELAAPAVGVLGNVLQLAEVVQSLADAPVVDVRTLVQ
eukprot:12172072-Alexandrium_andersonii.AAC.1